jgi:16S rRNA G966 N2-methylase RsmD
MINKNFYPTPPEVVEKMIRNFFEVYKGDTASPKRYFQQEITILEPSAGKGDILEHIESRLYYSHSFEKSVYVIEIEPELQSILRDKNYNVIGDDFLKYKGALNFDLILMNPPFDKGDLHLLKAIEIMENGGICCLLNSATLKNPYTKTRKQLANKLKELGATIEHLGQVFKAAERSTPIETSMVTIHVKTEKESFEQFDDLFEGIKEEFPEDIVGNQMATHDILASYESLYNDVLKTYKDATITYKRFRRVVTHLDKYNKSLELNHNYNEFVRHITATAWDKLLDESKFTSYLPDKTKRDFLGKFSSQKVIPFTKENMISMFDIIFTNREHFINQGMLDVFEGITKHHHENRASIEGWKTNEAYKISKKIIIPCDFGYGNYMSADSIKEYGDNFSMSRHNSYTTLMCDLDRVIAQLDGNKYADLHEQKDTIFQAIENKFNIIGKVKTGDQFDNTTESKYFHIKFYKKGSVHLTFKDKELLYMFNKVVCELRGFPLPEKIYKKQKQEDMKGATYRDNVLSPTLF